MEKFASTLILLFLVAGLAFGGSRNDNNSFGFSNNESNSKSIDNQENTDQDKYFIKYNVNGETDSLPVNQKIKDGQYNFNNSLYDVDMTVKNQRVTTFKINGLDVDGKDFPKFERMINELVSSKQEDFQDVEPENANDHSVTHNQTHIDADNVEFRNGNAFSFLGDGKITLVKNGKTSTLTLDENGGRFLIIKNNQGGEPTTVSLSKDNKTIRIGGINANLAALRKLDWTVTDKGLQPIGGFPNIQPAPPMPPVPPVPSYDNNGNIGYYHSDEKSNKRGNGAETSSSQVGFTYSHSDDGDEGGGVSGDDGDEGATITRGSSNIDGQRSVTSTKRGNDNGSEEFDQWLEKELVKDGYIKSVKRYNFVWTDAYMRVAGKNVSDEHRQKYVKMHKKIMGKEIGKTFHITRNKETE